MSSSLTDGNRQSTSLAQLQPGALPCPITMEPSAFIQLPPKFNPINRTSPSDEQSNQQQPQGVFVTQQSSLGREMAFDPISNKITCQFCEASIATKVKLSPTSKTHLWACCLCFWFTKTHLSIIMADSVPLMMYAEEDVETGGKSVDGDFAYRNNVHQAKLGVRLAFLRKVYSLLFVQLTATVIVGFVIMMNPVFRLYVHNNDWMVSVAFLLSVVILIGLHWKRRDYPTNFILLAAFTVIQAYSVGVVVTYFEQFVVLQALLLTVTVVAGLTTFTFQSKRDFSSLGSFLFAALCVLIIGGLMNIIFVSSTFELLLSIAGALLFSLFIIYDTQEIMKRLSPEEYILATITLYLDIINLFLYILRTLEAARR